MHVSRLNYPAGKTIRLLLIIYVSAITVVSLALTTLLATETIKRSMLPYNEAGVFLDIDNAVTYHEQAVFPLALISGLLIPFTIFCFILLFKSIKK